MTKRPIHRLNGDSTTMEMDELAEESIVTIYNGQEIVVRLLATPIDLEDLARGHIICEGRGNIESILVDGFTVKVSGEITPRPTEDLLTAACGACTSGEIEIPLELIENTLNLEGDIGKMMNQMKDNQPLFKQTGGIHAASIFDQTGKILLTREDIGRHNAFDKAVGAAKKGEIQAKIIGLSGRIGWELVAKAVRSGIEIIIAVGAISSAAESLARSTGMTLVGFATRERPVVIGDLSRIIDKPSINRANYVG